MGSHLVEECVGRGHETIVLDDKLDGKLENIAGCLHSPLLKVLDGDVRDSVNITKASRDADCVVHLAAMVNVKMSIENPQLTTEVNVIGTLNVLRACVENKVRRVIYASTASVYPSSRRPQREDCVLESRTPYAASKIAGEALCKSFASAFRLETIIFRFFNVYGICRSNPNPSVIVRFGESIKKGESLLIFGDGHQTRDFVHVSDVADAVELAIENESSDETFNVGTGKQTSINQLASIFARVNGDSTPRVIHEKTREYEIRHSCADITKARRLLGYQPRTDLKTGIEEYLSWAL